MTFGNSKPGAVLTETIKGTKPEAIPQPSPSLEEVETVTANPAKDPKKKATKKK